MKLALVAFACALLLTGAHGALSNEAEEAERWHLNVTTEHEKSTWVIKLQPPDAEPSAAISCEERGKEVRFLVSAPPAATMAIAAHARDEGHLKTRPLTIKTPSGESFQVQYFTLQKADPRVRDLFSRSITIWDSPSSTSRHVSFPANDETHEAGLFRAFLRGCLR
ncbi:hypothetical protein [Bosea sp. (in: a-proteobacteria)]|uniref:hypothetical protein n=1 Tax=Bosea sp. (in: a-proteobacteria) TaxID=1871050 RepID=UPI001AC8DFE3|nr:hypothetical protein [Bosea sp. (in: a-proteobacteria)]MBN9438064.1 hypothetical protein [Bosea sp. (in: a-proteobacteria)]